MQFSYIGVHLSLSVFTCGRVELISRHHRCWDQLILKRCDSLADVVLCGGLHKQRPLLETEAAHVTGGLSRLWQQRSELSGPLHVQRGPSRVNARFDAGVQALAGSRRRLQVGSEVDDDGTSGIEPLQRTFGAAKVNLLHVPAVRLVRQTAAERNQVVKTTTLFFDQTFGRKVLKSPILVSQ